MLPHTTSPIVDGTLYVLIAFSILTWCVIAGKAWQQLRIAKRTRAFDKMFWGAPDLESAVRLELPDCPKGRMLLASINALTDSGAGGWRDLEHTGTQQDILERTLRQHIQKERGAMESGLTLLASVGSTAPFVGLFGTVWGIMHALQDITRKGSGSLDVVAGPVGEALIATATGIAVAIPAVLAYNFFLRRTKLQIGDLDFFAVDFLHLAMKHDYQINTGDKS